MTDCNAKHFFFFAKHVTNNLLDVQRPEYFVHFNLSSSLFSVMMFHIQNHKGN